MHAGNSLWLLGEYGIFAFLLGLLTEQSCCTLTEFPEIYAGESWCGEHKVMSLRMPCSDNGWYIADTLVGGCHLFVSMF